LVGRASVAEVLDLLIGIDNRTSVAVRRAVVLECESMCPTHSTWGLVGQTTNGPVSSYPVLGSIQVNLIDKTRSDQANIVTLTVC
jgi:hypothetical protein